VTGAAAGNASASRQGVVADAAADADAIASMDTQKKDAPPASQPADPKEPKKNTSNL
jgi:hypothetical protein